MTDKKKEELLAALAATEQQHLLAFWDELDDATKARLTSQIEQVDFDLVMQLARGEDEAPDWAALADEAKPPRALRLSGQGNEFTVEDATARAAKALRSGKLGMILVAGGQGTRLGFHHPKGLFSLGPVSGRCLFQILIEKLLAVRCRYDVRIPLYLMTSPATHGETVAFLDEHNRFGLPADDLRIFCQGVMPAVDAETGRVLLAHRGSLFLSPDGHGGLLAAFHRSGCLEDAKQRGVEHLFYGQIDNPLLQICDERLIGYHLLAKSEMTSQVVPKRDPLENVGSVAEIRGQMRIIEYSDLPEQVARLRDDDGTLRLWAGSIAVHVFELEFLDRMKDAVDALPFHRAAKKAFHVNDDGQDVKPTEPNAIKFERFIFDLLPSARNAVVVEVDPQEAFAPVKNAAGTATDTAETARAAMVRQDLAKLEAAGIRVAEGVPVEINPLWALDSDEVARKIDPNQTITEPTYFH
ncbi:MAG: UTP--glucose-1-phosphate uridylyltransferase [Pirellulaceae bacterium]